MIIDKHDGFVASMRMTSDEAAFLHACIESLTYVTNSQFAKHFPNVSPEHLGMMLRKASQGQTE